MIRSPARITVPEVSVQDAVFSGLDKKRSTVALVNGETLQSFTYGELHDYTLAMGSGLERRGVRKGDVVGLFSTNCPEYCISCLAVWSVGAVVSGINFNYTAYEVSHQVNDAGIKAIIAMEKNVAVVREVLKTSKTLKLIITIDKPVQGCIYIGDLMREAGSALPPKVWLRPRDDLACIMYSSGTTGRPKGVMLTHYNLVANILMISYAVDGVLDLNAYLTDRHQKEGVQQVSLGFLPLFHMYGCIMTLTFMYLGAKIITLSAFRPETFLGAIQNFSVRELHLVPPVVVFLAKSPLVAKYDLSSLRGVVSAAAPLTEDTEREFLRRFNLDAIYQAYGMTELTSLAVYMPHGKPRPGSAGLLCPNTEAKIVSLTTGEVVGVGEEGEICARGPQTMKGYLHRPEATADMVDTDGWVHTGDVGYYDKDGYFFITGRIKELIKFKGFQVAPAELEGLLLRHPAVEDAAVIGVPDVSAGELPRAFIVTRPGVHVTEQDIYHFIKARLSRHKWLSGGVQFVTNIPKTASGKIVRREVKKMLRSSKL